MTKAEIIRLIQAALCELKEAAQKMVEDTVPATPLPRPRRFVFVRGVEYPYINKKGEPNWESVKVGGNEGYLPGSISYYCNVTHDIAARTQFKPRNVLRAIRRIQAATEWCKARHKGRLRAAKEVVKQQKKAYEILEAELAINNLKQ